MPLNVRNLDWLKNLTQWGTDSGTKMAEMINSISQGVNNIESQTNSSATGPPPPPPAVNALHVTANHGHFQIAVNHDGAEFYRGIQYHIEHASNAQFTDAHPIDMGTSRNMNLFLGNTTRFFRAAASYGSSPPGPWVYHGGASTPKPVTGGGVIPGPNFAPPQGSGTGTAGQGLSGPGPIPFRTNSGGPPVR